MNFKYQSSPLSCAWSQLSNNSKEINQKKVNRHVYKCSRYNRFDHLDSFCFDKSRRSKGSTLDLLELLCISVVPQNFPSLFPLFIWLLVWEFICIHSLQMHVHRAFILTLANIHHIFKVCGYLYLTKARVCWRIKPRGFWCFLHLGQALKS